MSIIIQHTGPIPKTGNRALDFAIDVLNKILTGIVSLVTLDDKLRATRTLVAERGVNFQGLTVVAGAVTAFDVSIPDVITKDYTTALIMFDATSGSGRFRYDGQNPVSAATAVAGLPIPAGGFQLTLTGALNIRSFRVIGEPAQTLNLSVMLHQ